MNLCMRERQGSAPDPPPQPHRTILSLFCLGGADHSFLSSLKEDFCNAARGSCLFQNVSRSGHVLKCPGIEEELPQEIRQIFPEFMLSEHANPSVLYCC